MKCRECNQELEVARSCGRVRMKCTGCQKLYQIHEIAADLDDKTVAILERYTAIIYD